MEEKGSCIPALAYSVYMGQFSDWEPQHKKNV